MSVQPQHAVGAGSNARVGLRLTPDTPKPALLDQDARGNPAILGRQEWRIAELVTLALSNKEIAFRLGLTTGTVKEYVFHIFKKLKLSNRMELGLWTVEKQRKYRLVERRIAAKGCRRAA